MELRGRDVLKVRELPGTFDYSAESKLAGKQYKRFAYKEKVFVVNTEDKFIKDFNEGKVYSIELSTDEEGQLGFAGHTTVGQEITMKKTEVMLDSITVENIKVTMSELEGAIS